MTYFPTPPPERSRRSFLLRISPARFPALLAIACTSMLLFTSGTLASATAATSGAHASSTTKRARAKTTRPRAKTTRTCKKETGPGSTKDKRTHKRGRRTRCVAAARARKARKAHEGTKASVGHKQTRKHATSKGTGGSAKKGPGSSSQSSAAIIAGVLGTPCENTELTPTAGDLTQVEGATGCLINQARARNGELPLRANAGLTRAARDHSAEMVREDYFAHVSPGGVTPLQRMEADGYGPGPGQGYVVGENIAWGTLGLSTPKAIVAAWLASPEHRANILEGHYVDTGIGIAPAAPSSLAEGEPGAVYSQEFGVIEG